VRNKQFKFAQIIGVIVFLSAGCAYKMGLPSNMPSKFDIQVINDSLIPQLGPAVNSQISSKILKKGLELSGIGKSNKDSATIRVRIFNSSDLAEIFSTNDSLLASGFKLEVSAEVTFENRLGKTIDSQIIHADSIALRPHENASPVRGSSVTALAEGLSNEVLLKLQMVNW
jgi:hypothetical protein